MPDQGGNVTGFSNFETRTAAKWLELLKEIAPQIKSGARHVAIAFACTIDDAARRRRNKPIVRGRG
jgi:hypothetical protein